MKQAASANPFRQPFSAWARVLALLGAATAAGWWLDAHVSLTSQAMLYVLVVAVASYTSPLWVSVVCALGAVTALNFFFVPPRWTFAVDSQEHLIALLTLLVVALAISHLASKLRHESEQSRVHAQRAHQLQTLATALANAPDATEVISLGQGALDAAFAGPNTLALWQPDTASEWMPTPPEGLRDGLRSCLREAAVLGPGTGRWPGLNAWYLPLGQTGQMLGAVCIQHIEAADGPGREHAQALCTLLAEALLRLKLTAVMQASVAETQRQQLQSTFLAAISHDLRTPLAAVVGAASALQTQGERLSADARERLLHSIASEANYLSTLTENTLQLVQLTNAAQPLRRDWQSVEEMVGAVLARLRLRDTRRRITARVPAGLPLVEADAVLLAQLLANLLDNALKYSSGPVELVARVHTHPNGSELQLSVKDRGEPIAADQQQRIFQPYSRSDRSGQHGAGLGLALCRAIATAHGGSLTLHKRQGGGNTFTFAMPVNPQQPQGEEP
jgi:two-component system, OmpR family, sensor histidine kinase KdpD